MQVVHKLNFFEHRYSIWSMFISLQNHNLSLGFMFNLEMQKKRFEIIIRALVIDLVL